MKLTVNGRGTLTAEASATPEGIRIRLDDANWGAFWAEVYLTPAQLNELLADVQPQPPDEGPGYRDFAPAKDCYPEDDEQDPDLPF